MLKLRSVMANVARRRPVDALLADALLVLLALYLAAEAWFSLSWRMMHDTPLILYPVFLLERFGMAPYRDVFTNTFPGTLLLELGLTRLFGYGDLAIRLLDLGWLAGLMAAAYGLMAAFGRRVAVAAALLFGVIYLNAGQILSFQRDYIALLPVALALLLAARPRGPLPLRAFLIGLLFGMAASIKPHLGLGLPLVLGYMLWETSASRDKAALLRAWGVALPLAALAAALPLLISLGWVWRLGAWPAFRDMVRLYLPLYLDMNGDHVTLWGIRRWLYLWRGAGQMGGFGAWLLPAGIGLSIILFRRPLAPQAKRLLALLVGLLFVHGLVAVLGGKFWLYHWLPFLYVLLLLAALSLSAVGQHSLRQAERVAVVLVLALLVALGAPPSNDFVSQLFGHPPRQPNDGRVDEIAAFLRAHVAPGDSVQQLDWTGGATQAMLEAGVRMATPYMEDYVFYHHVSDPYIQAQRRRFVAMLQEAPPRYVIEVLKSPRPSGRDASTDFPELRAILATAYAPVEEGDGYVIYERRDN